VIHSFSIAITPSVLFSALEVRPCPGNHTNERSITDHCLVSPQSILHASLEHNALSLEKFSRWLRAICTILLSRDSNADRPRAIGFVEQAIGVLKEERDVEVRLSVFGLVREGERGSMCIMVNVMERIRLGKTPPLFRLHSCSYPDRLTNRVAG
jgi:hypothetical protein